jgi:hypothetical protein
MTFALLAVVLQTIVGWIVAVRLLALARRTRELPELLLGVSLLASVALGYPFRIAGPALGNAAIDFAGNALVSLGFALAAVFTQRVFRAGFGWARALSALLALGYLAQSLLCSGERAIPATLWQMELAVVTYGWAACEAGMRARMQQRQLAIGLGDPVVCNRLWLFTLMGAAVVLGAAANAIGILAGLQPLEEPAILIATTVSGTTLAVTTLLAFAPPAFYRRRIAARA